MSVCPYKHHKPSGVDWIGEVPQNWQVTRLKRLFEIRKRIAGTEGYNVLSITQRGIKVKDTESNDGQLSMDYAKYQLVYPGDFAMNHMDLLTGYVDLSSQLGVTSPDYRVFALRDQSAYARYFLYLLQNGYHQELFFPFGQGSSELGRWRLPTEQFNEFRFPNPPPTEQAAISNFLDRETAKIDALVAEQKRLIELLKEKRQAVIAHAVTKGLNSKAPMKPSGIEWLGNVPAHWQIKALKLIGTFKAGAGFPDDEQGREDEELSFHKVNALGKAGRDDFLLPSENTVSTVTAKKLRAHVFPVGSIVFAKIGAALLLGRIRRLNGPACLDNNMMGLVIDKHHDGNFVRQLMSLIRFDFIANPGTVPSLNESQISTLRFAFPPQEEQLAISSKIDSALKELDDLASSAALSVELMKERRSSLISAAVTGKIDVRGLVSEQVAA